MGVFTNISLIASDVNHIFMLICRLSTLFRNVFWKFPDDPVVRTSLKAQIRKLKSCMAKKKTKTTQKCLLPIL